MPKQEVFFDQEAGDRRIEVLKSYDQSYAREAFDSMDGASMRRLWASLNPEASYDPAGLPELGAPNGDGESFLWDELLDQAREDGSLLSFFVVNETAGHRTESLFVSPDWPTAEAFARDRTVVTP